MDTGPFVAGIAKARAALKSLEGDLKIRTDGLDQAAAKVAALKTALGGLSANVRVSTDGLNAMAAKTAAAGAATAGATALMVNGWRMTGTALHWVIAGGTELLAVALPAIVALGAGMAVMSQGAQMVQQHMQAVFTATSADGQMFGKTAGQVIGLKTSLQAAQDAANPAVYGILGSAIITVNEHFGSLAGTGLKVAQMFQTFAAKVAVDFGPGGGLADKTTALLSHMTSDLQGLGQVLGNTGHAFVNFAAAMPGLAEVLLKMLSGITGFASHLIGMAAPLLTVVMGFEEFNRWGGLVVNTLTKLGIASASLSGGAFSFERFAGVIRGFASILPMAVSGLSALAARFALVMGSLSMASGEGKIASFFGSIGIGAAKASGELGGMTGGLRAAIAAMTPLQAVIGVGLAVGLGILIDKLVTARSAAQQFGDALQQSLMKATNTSAMGVAINNIGLLNQKLAQTSVPAVTAASNIKGLGSVIHNLAQQNVNELSSALRQQQQETQNVAQGAALIAKTYGTTFVGALALADQANVKLASGITGTSQAAMVARMQIQSLVQGYQAMGQSAGQVGNDVTMLAIQSGLAASNVGKLNSAAQEFMTNLTGGMSGLAGFATSLQNVGSVVASFHDNLGKALSIKDSVSQFAQALSSGAIKGAAAWQNFSQIVGQTGPQLISWMRTAGAEGALGAKGFTQAALDMASALMPLGAASKTAQAEILGLVATAVPGITTWQQLGAAVKGSGASLGGLNGIISGATAKMANMNSVAQTLGNVLSSALVSALQAAQVQASGAGAAMQAYAQDLMNGNKAAASADYSRLISDLEKLGLSASQAAALIAQVSQNLNSMPSSKTVTVTTIMQTIGGSAAYAPGVSLPGHAAGTPSAPAGWSWVGEAGPELVRFRGGETVVPNNVARGFAGGAGMPGDQHINIYLDGKQIYSSVQKQSVATQRRTGANGMTKRTR